MNDFPKTPLCFKLLFFFFFMCVPLCMFKIKDCWRNVKSDFSTPFSWILSFHSLHRSIQLLLSLLLIFPHMFLADFQSGRKRLVWTKESRLCLMLWLWVSRSSVVVLNSYSNPGLLGCEACARLAGVSSCFTGEVSAVHPEEQHRNSQAP